LTRSRILFMWFFLPDIIGKNVEPSWTTNEKMFFFVCVC
jgi:hypothetical protein